MSARYTKVYILFYSGRSLFSYLIRWQTRSKYSHCAIMFDDGWIYESVEGTGVRRRRCSEEDKKADCYQVELYESQEMAARKWCHSQLGHKYDWPAVLRFISRRRVRGNGKWFCSEYVFADLIHVGLVPLRAEPWQVSPAILSMSPILHKRRFPESVPCESS